MRLFRFVSSSLSALTVLLFVSGCPQSVPTAAFSASPISGNAPLVVQFTNESVPGTGTGVTFAWAFGDGASSAAESPAHTYTSPGTYTVALTVSTSEGTHTETKSGLIEVEDETPEGEGEDEGEAEGDDEGETPVEGEGEGTPEGEPEGEPQQVQAAIMFVTQVPIGDDFANIMSTFGTHKANTESAPRGGDLYIRYADGTLRNLTAELGYGTQPGQDITVRDPYPHWTGTKALFSMVIGGTTQDDYTPVYFQMYEITGIGQDETAVITKLPQPADYNNVTPVYASDGRILFTSDRPRNGDRRLYPQRDEYESADTVSGLWSMARNGSNLHILDHSPSGDFSPFIDSYGRVIFTRWDHLQRDQQADADIYNIIRGEDLSYNSFTYESEDSDAYHALDPGDEVFPEQRGLHGPGDPETADPIWDNMLPTEQSHTLNHFFPWMMSQHGEGLEILNHLGRHELAGYVAPARTYLDYTGNEESVDIMLQLCESPVEPGRYYGVHCPEFGTHAAGQIVSLYAPPGRNADVIKPVFHTHPETASYVGDNETAPPEHVGMFRDPVALADGTLWVSHSSSSKADDQTVNNPPYPAPFEYSSRYNFAIRQLVPGTGGYLVPGARLVPPIVKSVSYFDSGMYRTVTYNGAMWELQAVEVRTHAAPPNEPIEEVPAIEQAVLEEELGGSAGVAELKEYLEENSLALIVSRDVTMRADEQQDINLKVAWSDHVSAEEGSTPKEIGYMQFFEGKQLRGYTRPGRRVLARPMDSFDNPTDAGAPESSVRLGDDGSMAAFVPAGRALSWQTTEADGTPAVRERYWLTFKAGEIRTCNNCHGINTSDVFGRPTPTNEPEALRSLLQWWLANEAE